MGEPLRRVQIGLVGLVVVVTIGTAGYILAGWDFLSALCIVIATVSGEGAGDILRLGPGTKVWTMLVIVFGLTAAGYTVGGFVQLLAEGEINRLLGRRRLSRRMKLMENHVIVCGFGRMGRLVCQELQQAARNFVLVDRDPRRTVQAEALGYPVITGDAVEEPTLIQAGVQRARAVVTVLPSDADNVFITLTARQLNPGLFLIARAEQPSTQKKLQGAGADRVVLPAVIGALRITGMLIRPTAVELMEIVTSRQRVGLEIDELSIAAGTPLCGRTLGESEVRRRTGVIVLAIKQADGTMVLNPDSQARIEAGDTVVVIGRTVDIDEFRRTYSV